MSDFKIIILTFANIFCKTNSVETTLSDLDSYSSETNSLKLKGEKDFSGNVTSSGNLLYIIIPIPKNPIENVVKKIISNMI